MARIATIESTISIRINTGNFESIDVSKTMKTDVEYDSPEQLVKKQAAFDASVFDAVKAQAETVMAGMGRKRRLSGTGAEIGLWAQLD